MKFQMIQKNIENGNLNPSIAKRKLALNIIENLYDHVSAENAENNFNRIFKDKAAPDQIDEFIIERKDYPSGKIKAFLLLAQSGLCASNSDAKRVIEQGGLKVGDNKITDVNIGINLGRNKLQSHSKRETIFFKNYS